MMKSCQFVVQIFLVLALVACNSGLVIDNVDKTLLPNQPMSGRQAVQAVDKVFRELNQRQRLDEKGKEIQRGEGVTLDIDQFTSEADITEKQKLRIINMVSNRGEKLIAKLTEGQGLPAPNTGGGSGSSSSHSSINPIPDPPDQLAGILSDLISGNSSPNPPNVAYLYPN